jgi:predicted transposase YbfD/YdcC
MKGKSNEIVAIPELLELLDLQGAVVTIDAIGTQRAIVDQIIQKGGDYVLPVKENQKTLVENLESVMMDLILDHQKGLPSKLRFHEQKEEGHGRCEIRKIWLSDDASLLRPKVLEAWPTIKGIAMVERYRQDYGDFSGTSASTERCFYITSLDGASAELVAGYIRGHWAVENNLHWQLDVSFNEDQQRMRKGFAAENHSRLNRMALNLLKQEKTVKLGIKNKRLSAGWDNDYLLTLITQ